MLTGINCSIVLLYFTLLYLYHLMSKYEMSNFEDKSTNSYEYRARLAS